MRKVVSKHLNVLKLLFSFMILKLNLILSSMFFFFFKIKCFLHFFLLKKYFFSYYTLMVWFPELFHRFDIFENFYGSDKKASVCEVSSIVIPSNGYTFLEFFFLLKMILTIYFYF